jgi:putative membrane protein
MRGLRAYARWWLPRHVASASIEGLENLPKSGPVLIAARHYHHLIDGAVLLARLPRPVHIIVALDWVRDRSQRRRMERVCRWARWPVIVRPSAANVSASYPGDEGARTLRSGLRDALALLREGRVVAIFPEGYPAVDRPERLASAPERDEAGFLPFAAGFRIVAARAARASANLSIVPMGFAYLRTGAGWSVRARLGAPLPASASVETVERAVRDLSQ